MIWREREKKKKERYIQNKIYGKKTRKEIKSMEKSDILRYEERKRTKKIRKSTTWGEKIFTKEKREKVKRVRKKQKRKQIFNNKRERGSELEDLVEWAQFAFYSRPETCYTTNQPPPTI